MVMPRLHIVAVGVLTAACLVASADGRPGEAWGAESGTGRLVMIPSR